MGFSLETVQEVWDDSTGERVEIGPDRDGLDLIEIRYRNPEGKIGARISMTKEQAALVGKALMRALGGTA
jgi:hypothetical protein